MSFDFNPFTGNFCLSKVAGGRNTEIQFNNVGNLDSSTSLTWNNTNLVLNATGKFASQNINPATNFQASQSAGISIYNLNDSLVYRLYTYFDVNGVHYYSANYVEKSVTITATGNNVNLSWTAAIGSSTGYVLILNKNGTGFIRINNEFQALSFIDDGTEFSLVASGTATDYLPSGKNDSVLKIKGGIELSGNTNSSGELKFISNTVSGTGSLTIKTSSDRLAGTTNQLYFLPRSPPANNYQVLNAVINFDSTGWDLVWTDIASLGYGTFFRLDLNNTATAPNQQVFKVTSNVAGGINDSLLLTADPSTATPTAGFGVGLQLRGKSTTTITQPMGRLDAYWIDATHATNKAAVKLTSWSASGAGSSYFVLENNGSGLAEAAIGGTTTSGTTLTISSQGATRNCLVLKSSGGTARFTVKDDGGYAFSGGTVGVAQTGYTTFTNLTTLRTVDVNTATLANVANILGTLIVDLKTKGIIAA